LLATAAAPALHFSRATGALALASGGLVWLAHFDRGLVFPKSRFDPVFLWVGSRSYSLYLIHQVSVGAASMIRDRFVELIPHLNPLSGVFIGVFLTIGSTLAFAELNFRFVETPLRKMGARLTSREHNQRGAAATRASIRYD
jgi:peptidoglycan/LPS O-acetylase OafA/YrhL